MLSRQDTTLKRASVFLIRLFLKACSTNTKSKPPAATMKLVSTTTLVSSSMPTPMPTPTLSSSSSSSCSLMRTAPSPLPRHQRVRTYAVGSGYPFGSSNASTEPFFEPPMGMANPASAARISAANAVSSSASSSSTSSPPPHHHQHLYQRHSFSSSTSQQRYGSIAASAVATAAAPPRSSSSSAAPASPSSSRSVFSFPPPPPPPPQQQQPRVPQQARFAPVAAVPPPVVPQQQQQQQQQPLDLTVEGTVSRVVFRAGHGGYTVFKMKLFPSSPPLPAAVAAALSSPAAKPPKGGAGAKASSGGDDNTITVVGGSLLLQSVARVGQPLRVKGKWTTHSRFGGQLAASSGPEGVEAIPFNFGGESSSSTSSSSSSASNYEAEAEAVANLLAGAKLPGVGPAIARRIVDALGGPSKALEALDDPGAALVLAKKVKGLSAKKAAAVKRAWDGDRNAAVAASFLRSARVPGKLAAELLRRHGGAVESAVRDDAFAAAAAAGASEGEGNRNGSELDVGGRSPAAFRAVDALAASLGNPPTAPRRAEAALLAAARSEAYARGGHTWVEWRQAAREARRLMSENGSWGGGEEGGEGGESRSWPSGPEGDCLLAEAAAEACRAGRLFIDPPPPPSLVGGGEREAAVLPPPPQAPPPPPPPQPRLSDDALAASLSSYLLYRCPSARGDVALALATHFGRALLGVLDSGVAERVLTGVQGVGPATARKVVASWRESGARGAAAWTEPAVVSAPAPPVPVPPSAPVLQQHSASASSSWPPPGARVAAPELAEAEASAARELSRLASSLISSTSSSSSSPPLPPAFDVASWLSSSPLAARLSEQQRAAVAAAVAGTSSSSGSGRKEKQKSSSSPSSVLLLTGGPGTGKTATTAAVVGAWLASGKKVALAAPTGRAAQRLQEVTGFPASTLHRLLAGGSQQGGSSKKDAANSSPLGLDENDTSSSNVEAFKHNSGNPLPHDALLVDEASLLDAPLAAALLGALKPGASLVLVGDPDQLPPVGPGAFLEDAVASSFEIENVSYDDMNDDGGNDDERSGKTFSSSPLLLLPRVHLSRRFRQSSRSAIVEAALAAHSGRAPLPLHALSAEELLYRRGGGGGGSNNSSQPPLPLPSEALLVVPGTLRNAGLPLSSSSSSPQQLIPGHYEHELRAVLTNLLPSAGFDPVSDVQVLSPVRAGALGTRRIGAFVRDLLNPTGGGNASAADLVLPGSGGNNGGAFASQQQAPSLSLRRGDKVMQNTNNYDSDVFNGEVGRVTSVELANNACTVAFDGGRVFRYAGFSELSQLEPAWAATVHKAQGGESPAVVLILDAAHHAPALSRRLLYTALTRARRCVVVVADERALAAALAPERKGGRRTSLVERLRGEARKTSGSFSSSDDADDGEFLSSSSASEFAA